VDLKFEASLGYTVSPNLKQNKKRKRRKRDREKERERERERERENTFYKKYVFWLVVLGFEIRTLYLLGRCSTLSATPFLLWLFLR
jgi:hypothetical protein